MICPRPHTLHSQRINDMGIPSLYVNSFIMDEGAHVCVCACVCFLINLLFKIPYEVDGQFIQTRLHQTNSRPLMLFSSSHHIKYNHTHAIIQLIVLSPPRWTNVCIHHKSLAILLRMDVHAHAYYHPQYTFLVMRMLSTV